MALPPPDPKVVNEYGEYKEPMVGGLHRCPRCRKDILWPLKDFENRSLLRCSTGCGFWCQEKTLPVWKAWFAKPVQTAVQFACAFLFMLFVAWILLRLGLIK
jgi:hypothetical protein